jgi:hypothetical protein
LEGGGALFAYRWIALAQCAGYFTSSSFHLRRITDAMPILQLVDLWDTCFQPPSGGRWWYGAIERSSDPVLTTNSLFFTA